MQIDWLTVTAELVNFLVLVWLLKRFLYRPVVDAMQRREQLISSRLAEANDRERLADDLERRYRDELAAVERNRSELLREASDAAEQEKLRLLETGREEVRAQRAQWLRDLERERRDFSGVIRRELALAAADIARGALAQLADVPLERQIIAAFRRRLDTLPHKARLSFVESADALRVTTSFELDEEGRESLRAALGEALGEPLEISFEHDRELVCGIELAARGHKLAWNLADFAAELEQRIGEKMSASTLAPA